LPWNLTLGAAPWRRAWEVAPRAGHPCARRPARAVRRAWGDSSR